MLFPDDKRIPSLSSSLFETSILVEEKVFSSIISFCGIVERFSAKGLIVNSVLFNTFDGTVWLVLIFEMDLVVFILVGVITVVL